MQEDGRSTGVAAAAGGGGLLTGPVCEKDAQAAGAQAADV